jgi:hypothetical protein
VTQHSLSVFERLLFALLVVAALVFSFLNVKDSTGWLLLLLSFPLFLLDPAVRSDKKTRYAVWIVLAAHHAITFVFVLGLVDLSIDAESFHRHAVKFATKGDHFFAIDFDFYVQAMGIIYRLGGFYRLGGASRLLAAQISVFGFAVALFYFLKILDLRKFGDLRPLAVLLFGCIPSVVIYTSIPLRESAELALLILFAYLFMLFLREPRAWLLLAVLPVLLLFGILHKGLILYAVFLAALVMLAAILVAVNKRVSPALLPVALLIPLGCIVTVYFVSYYDVPNSGVVNYFLSGEISENLKWGRELILRDNPRSAFSADIDFSSIGMFAVTYLQVYWQYMAAPFIWEVENMADIVASGEAMLRLTLLAATILSLFRKRFDTVASILLVLYLTMTMLWALGTTNYGQGVRHHVLTNWILVVLGLPYLQHLVNGRRRGNLVGAA